MTDKSSQEELQALAMADPVFDEALAAFDHKQQKRYHALVVSRDPLLVQVQVVAWGLERRGATELARTVQAGGLVTRDLIDKFLGEDPGMLSAAVGNYLTWLDCKVHIPEAAVLKLVLQGLAVDALKDELAGT